MNGEDAATYVYESMLYDARFETDYAKERDRYAQSQGYGGSCSNSDLGEIVSIALGMIADLEERIDELEQRIDDQEQMMKSPFVLVHRDQEVEINAKKVKQIQLTDEQFDRLLDKIS